jgi:hypothetical protein
MPEKDERMSKDLRCQKNNHPYTAEIWQRFHYVPQSNGILFITTPRYAYDYVMTCPECGSPPKDPNDPNA